MKLGNFIGREQVSKILEFSKTLETLQKEPAVLDVHWVIRSIHPFNLTSIQKVSCPGE